MTKDEMQSTLSQHLAKFRTWTYAQLAERVVRDRREHDCLDHLEGTVPEGTTYQIEINAFWDDKPHGDIRVCGDLSADPQKRLLGFLPIYTPDVTDSFIMSPDGTFVGEDERDIAEPGAGPNERERGHAS
ncbi:MAG: hypothetical protein H0X66_22345 [Verrucomicrobia bacterium]|nr:hypothetical protein [Verrucomicrobiota bacterium]